ncbi:hypothetical protein LF1_34720 [Rubripirellula obstinata]|uniref:Uncharacterized protein n=1 Tax=Rubripirellula obstinata TaxID=406547 RepID=A0A5B1CMY1_9BACT|nr:hypothetical protein [Rubripirellula obstinata]KAA1260930.1 hypothetical protein LF1_34720 [Rubripirellula obstinata]
MQTTTDSPAFIQTVHGTSFPFVGLARLSQSSIVETKEQSADAAKSDSLPPVTSGQTDEA